MKGAINPGLFGPFTLFDPAPPPPPFERDVDMGTILLHIIHVRMIIRVDRGIPTPITMERQVENLLSQGSATKVKS